MDKSQLIDLLNNNKPCCLATVDGEQPRVRGMVIYQANEEGLLLQTTRTKSLYRQLLANPRVELCFIIGTHNLQIRITGMVQEVDDLALKTSIFDEKGVLSAEKEDAGPDRLAVFQVRDAEARFWSFDRSVQDLEAIQF